MQGPMGDAGNPGLPGERGPGGAPGTAVNGTPGGPAGPAGFRGPKGPKGVPGEDRTGPKGNRGPGGRAGMAGPAGRVGANGKPGIPGNRGPQGPQGAAGKPGKNGASGKNGYQGPRGERGNPGEQGSSGPQGPQGPVGFPGESTSSKGPKGRQGVQGPPGMDGKRGRPGQIGQKGPAGPQGPAGKDGEDGIPGSPGAPGRPGSRGPEGPQGPRGPRGKDGINGGKGPQGPSAAPHSFIFTRHSQEITIPACPAGTTKLWDGYSLLFTQTNERAHGQDLGSAGSCPRMFSPMPFMFCDLNEQCNVASRNDYSYWLSTSENMPMTMENIKGQDLEKYISRCSVCETESKVMAVRSQDDEIPECPANWDSLWMGYSFVMHTGAGSQGGGQSLSSPGSCLETFRNSPFIECHGRGTCNYFASTYSFWLTTVSSDQQFAKPVSETLKSGNLRSRISRCQVCRRAIDSVSGYISSPTNSFVSQNDSTASGENLYADYASL